jgi:hypothetical protein
MRASSSSRFCSESVKLDREMIDMAHQLMKSIGDEWSWSKSDGKAQPSLPHSRHEFKLLYSWCISGRTTKKARLAPRLLFT